MPNGENSIELEKMSSEVKNGRFSVRLYVKNGGKVYIKRMLSVKVFSKTLTVVALRRIRTRQEIKPEEVVLKEQYVSCNAPYCTSLNSVAGKIARFEIAEGTAIMKRDIEEKPLVRKGDIVTAIFSKKNLSVAMKVRAMEKGIEGDVIKLFDSSMKKHFTGKIISPDKVEVMF